MIIADYNYYDEQNKDLLHVFAVVFDTFGLTNCKAIFKTEQKLILK